MRSVASLLLACTIAVLAASPARASIPLPRATGGGSFVDIPGWPKAEIDSRLLGDVAFSTSVRAAARTARGTTSTARSVWLLNSSSVWLLTP